MRFTIRELLLVTIIVGVGVGWWLEHRANSIRIERLRFIAMKLAESLNGRDDIEVKVVNDHMFFRTGASQNPPPEWWPK
jgi:hypothetical protein